MQKQATRGAIFSLVMSKSSSQIQVLSTDRIGSIINVMKFWVTTPYFKVDAVVLEHMKEFLWSVRFRIPLAGELYSAIAARV